jgi:hypothetical protein
MSKILEYGKFYGAEPRVIGKTELVWFNNLKNEIANHSDYPNNIVINCTWINIGEDMLNFVFQNGRPNDTKLWFTGTVDGLYWLHHTHSFKYLQLTGWQIEFVGNSETHFHSWFPNVMFKFNDLSSITAPSGKYLFLSYNRKPRPWRQKLVQTLIENNLHTKGFITFEEGHFPEIDNQTKDYDQDLHTDDLRYSRPEDILTIGDMNVWNDCYSVIVSETEITDPWQLSEKTWKPIMALRPYFLNSNSGVVNQLEKLGIYTPAMLFKNEKLNDCSITEIVNQLMLIDDPIELYQSQLDMLKHNQKRFIEIANTDLTKILNWPHAS